MVDDPPGEEIKQAPAPVVNWGDYEINNQIQQMGQQPMRARKYTEKVDILLDSDSD